MEDTNDRYDLEIAATAQSKWLFHAYPLNQVLLDEELARLPNDLPIIRYLAEDQLAEWTLRI